MLLSTNPEYDGYFGYSVSGAGDVNGDGHANVIVGAHNEDGEVTDDGRGYVFVVPPLMVQSGSGVDGQVVLQWPVCPEVAGFWVYGAEKEAYLRPGLTAPWVYRLAVLPPPAPRGRARTASSNRFGEFDYSSIP